MKLFGFNKHRDRRPRIPVPPWVADLQRTLGLRFAELEKKMAKIDDAVAALATAQQNNHDAVVTEIDALKAAIAAGDQTAANNAADKIMETVANMNADTQALKDSQQPSTAQPAG